MTRPARPTTPIEFSDEAMEGLERLAALRHLPDIGKALEEAVGVALAVAEEWAAGTDVVLVHPGRAPRQLVPPTVW